MEGRARHQRDDGRRGPADARVPGHPDTRGNRANRTLDPLTAARGWQLGGISRRSGRSIDLGRGLGGIAISRGRARGATHGESGRVCARRRWSRKQSRIHANMVFALWFMVLGRLPGAAAGAHIFPLVGAAEHLRLGLLGTRNDCAADGRLHAKTCAPYGHLVSTSCVRDGAASSTGRGPSRACSSGSTNYCTGTRGIRSDRCEGRR